MTDNEAKARAKLAEGRKKQQGGGGFFSKLLGGGGGSCEPADCFVQEEMEAEELEKYDDHPECEIECSYHGCYYVASNLLDFEKHYSQHSFQCSVCGISFDTARRLEVHQDERHNPFFNLNVSRQPDVAHFRCLHPSCDKRFSNSRTRDEHSRIIHLINGETSRRRKFDGNVLAADISKMSMAEDSEVGWNGEEHHSVDVKSQRPMKKAVRRQK